jgi:hypothetical protein
MFCHRFVVIQLICADGALHEKKLVWRQVYKEHWNNETLGTFVFHLVEKFYGSWDKQTF